MRVDPEAVARLMAAVADDGGGEITERDAEAVLTAVALDPSAATVVLIPDGPVAYTVKGRRLRPPEAFHVAFATDWVIKSAAPIAARGGARRVESTSRKDTRDAQD